MSFFFPFIVKKLLKLIQIYIIILKTINNNRLLSHFI
nr:MAG TPA: hypothetical protein [Caudoviricetes sp.]DAV07963.1 MAG TPA: hypothetical protein [Caudoviricetes sp.]